MSSIIIKLIIVIHIPSDLLFFLKLLLITLSTQVSLVTAYVVQETVTNSDKGV